MGGNSKAIAAAIMSFAAIIDLWFGSGWWSHLVEEDVGIAINVLTPIIVWAIPDNWFSRHA
jgi:hypothetical protein